jgi:hypothetical protein
MSDRFAGNSQHVVSDIIELAFYSSFKFVAFVHLVQSTGVVILGHTRAPRKVHSRTRRARIPR